MIYHVCVCVRSLLERQQDASNEGGVAAVVLEHVVSHMPAQVFSCFDRDQSGEITIQDPETGSSWRCREVARVGGD